MASASVPCLGVHQKGSIARSCHKPFSPLHQFWSVVYHKNQKPVRLQLSNVYALLLSLKDLYLHCSFWGSPLLHVHIAVNRNNQIQIRFSQRGFLSMTILIKGAPICDVTISSISSALQFRTVH